ncbi:MAG: DUF4367 domain-containing protein [Clostridiales bacterium]|nr:DUF4367 domain-containing protein [Clostridiales bacterium]
MNRQAETSPKLDRKTAAQLREEIEELKLELIFRETEEEIYARNALEAQQDTRVDKWVQKQVLQSIGNTEYPVSRKKYFNSHAYHFRMPTRAAACIAFLIVFLLGSGTGFAAATYLQKQAGKFVIEPSTEEIVFRFQMAQEPIPVPAEWHGEYFPSYIPEGFALTKVSSPDSNCNKAYYENSDGVSIVFGELGTNAVFGINSENASVTRKEIGGRMATISETEISTVIVLIEGDKILLIEVAYLSSDENTSTAMQIAESILILQ